MTARLGIDQDARLVMLMEHIAQKHGCTVIIDFDTRQILFEGPEEAKTALAIELDKYVC